MWSLESIKQINAEHAAQGHDGKPVDARKVYANCGIRVLGDSYKGNSNAADVQAGQDQELRNSDSHGY